MSEIYATLDNADKQHKQKQQELQIKFKVINISELLPKQEQNDSIIENKNISSTKGEEIMKYQGHTIYKRTDNRWATKIKDKGKYIYIYGKTQQECYDKLKKTLNKQTKKDKIQKITYNKNTTTFIKWVEQWFELCKKNIKDGTKEDYKSVIKNYLTPLYEVELNKLTSIQIQTLINNLPGKRLPQKTFTLINNILKDAIRFDKLTINPMDKLVKPKYTAKEKQYLEQEDEVKFIELCKQSEYGDILLVILYQGLRRGEALGIHREDLNFDKNTISIIEREGIRIKNKNSQTTIPMFDHTKEILLKYQNYKGRLWNIDPKTLQLGLQKIITKLNLTGITLHSLRHTFITRCAELGISVKATQNITRQKTSKVTEDIYTHYTEKMKVDTITKLNNYYK